MQSRLSSAVELKGLDPAGGEWSAASPPAPLQAAFHLDLLFDPADMAWGAVGRLPSSSLGLLSGDGKNILKPFARALGLWGGHTACLGAYLQKMGFFLAVLL